MSSKINPSLNATASANLEEYTHLVAVPALPTASVEFKDAVYFLNTDGRLYRCIQQTDGSWYWQATTVSPSKVDQIDSVLESLAQQGNVGDTALRAEFAEYKTQMTQTISGLATTTSVFNLDQRVTALESSSQSSNVAKLLTFANTVAALSIPDPFTGEDIIAVLNGIINAAKAVVNTQGGN